MALEVRQERGTNLVRMHAPILLIASSALDAKPRMDLRRVEALADETPHDSRARVLIERRHVDSSESPFDRTVEQGGLIDLREHLVHGLLRGGCADPELPDFLQHASAPASFDDCTKAS